MKRIYPLSLFFLLLFFFRTHSAHALTLDDLKRKYQGIQTFKAHITQTKTSPLLLRPLKTEIDIRYDKGLLSWQPAGQEAWQLRFTDKGEAVFVKGGKSLEQLPAAARDKLQRSLRLIHDLMVLHPKIEDNYKLTMKDKELSVSSRSGDILFQKVLLRFKADATLEEMILGTAEDETILQFQDLTIGRT